MKTGDDWLDTLYQRTNEFFILGDSQVFFTERNDAKIELDKS